MARKNNARAAEATGTSIQFDARTRTVMAAEPSHDNVKEKVNAVREVVPGKSNNEVVLVLQYYDYNVERAIQAYLEDGAKEALQEWNFTGTKQPNKKRKNKKKASEKGGAGTSAADGKQEPVNGKERIQNGLDHSETDSPLDSPTVPPHTTIQDAAAATSTTAASKPSQSNSSSARSTDNALPQREPQHRRRNHKDSHSASHNHHNANRERTVSEVSTGSGIGDGHKKHHGLDKALKDLQRQTTSLERLRHVLDHEIDRSYRSLKTVFEELRAGLSDREFQLMAEMDMLKREATEMLTVRQNKASELKRQVERAEKLKDSELAELRTEIKHFVSDRRHDDDLGRTTRFLYDSDHLMEQVRKFGEVIHVKPMYSNRRPSNSSVASSGPSHADPMEEGFAQSQDMSDLQDRLKNSLKIQNSPTRTAHSSSSEPSSLNGPVSSGSPNHIDSPSHNQRTQKGGNQGSRGGKQAQPNVAGSFSEPSQESHGDSQRQQRPFSATGSPSRGRGRGGGGRGRGRGRGAGGRGGQGGEPRPQSSQGSTRPQSGGQPRSVVTSSAGD